MRYFQFKLKALLIVLTTLLLAANSSYVYPQTSQVADKYGNQLLTRSNPITHSVKRIYRVKVPITRYGVSIEQINPSNIRQLGAGIIKDYEDILDISSDDLKVYRSKQGRNSSWHLGFRQLYKDVPIWESYVRFTIEGQGLVNTISANIYPNIKLSVDPNISADDALSTALNAYKEDDIDTIIVKEKPDLFIYPKIEEDSVSYYLTYKVDLVSIGLLCFVDAFSGEIVETINNWVDYNNNGTVSIKYFPKHYYDTPVIYDGFSGVHVKIEDEQHRSQGGGYTDSNGDYSINWTGEDPMYYLIGTGNFQLSNDYVEICNYETFEHEYEFFPSSNYEHDWSYDNDETNVFYHVNVIHDYITASPFYFDDMDYQMDAYVHEGESFNAYSTGTIIGFGTKGNHQWARSSDAVYHEYTHCIIHHLYNGWIGFPEKYTHGYAMDEGFADYFACTLNDDSRAGESVGLPAYRNLDNSKTTDDYIESGDNYAPYKNGMIVAGAVWDMRETASIGVALADELLFFALDRNPDEFGELLDDILYEDDTDADVSNGTPHIDAILYAFENHKIYPSDSDVPPAAPTNLTVSNSNDHPRLDWDENTEPDLEEYDIWKYASANDPTWRKTATVANNYWIDDEVDTGDPAERIYYKAKAVDYEDNESSFSNTVWIDGYTIEKPIAGLRNILPTTFNLKQNFPNPFNPSTTFEYSLPVASKVELNIYNINGQLVESFISSSQSAGYQQYIWNGVNSNGDPVPSGIYIIQFKAEPLEGNEKSYEKSIKATMLK